MDFIQMYHHRIIIIFTIIIGHKCQHSYSRTYTDDQSSVL
jgi:hypothetical protein